MMTPTTLMNIIRATGSTSVANDVADLRLAQNLPTATPAPAVRQGAQQTLPQAPFASGPPVTGQGNPTNARPASMEMARPVIAASAHRSLQTALAPSGSQAATQDQGANVDRSSVAPSVTLMRSFFQSLPAPMVQGAGVGPNVPQPPQQGGEAVVAQRPTTTDQPDMPQGTVVQTARSAVSASVGTTGASGLHPAMAQLDRVLDQLAAQFLPRGPKLTPSRGVTQPSLQSAAAAMPAVPLPLRPGPVPLVTPLPAGTPAQTGTPNSLSPQLMLQFPQLGPLLRDATWQVVSHPNLAPVVSEFMQAGAVVAPSAQPAAQTAQLPRSDAMAAAIAATLVDANEAVQSAPVPPTQPAIPITARDLSILVAMNAAMLPGFPNLMSSQTAAALRSRDLGQKLADLAHKLRTMDPQEQRVFLAGLHLPIRVLHDLQRQAKKWARHLGDVITPDTIEGFLLLCLTVLGWPTAVAEYLWYCLTATDDPDDIPTYDVWNG